MKSQVFQNKAGSWLGLVAWLSREFQPWGNWTASCPILSCSAPASVTLQLLACLAREQFLAACSCKSPARSSCESLFFLHILEHFFTLSHSLPLQESHLNTELLIAKIQANLARNKANKMVDKIQPYNCGRTLDIYVTAVNRSSNLSWIISEWFCWSWNMHRLVPIYFPAHLFYCFCLKSSPNVNFQMKRDIEL